MARLAVLYEDFRFEYDQLLAAWEVLDRTGHITNNYGVFYYIRRTLVSAVEYASVLNAITGDQEFKLAKVTANPKYISAVDRANCYLQNNFELIRRLRNDFGGHFQLKVARHAVENFPASAAACLRWQEGEENRWALRLDDLALHIMTSGLGCSLGEDTVIEYRRAIQVLGVASNHVQEGTYALTLMFLWSRFTG